MKTLVTGAHGFIGSHLCEYLLSQGCEVKALASPWGKLDNLASILEHPKLLLYKVDITKKEDLTWACQDIDVVFHAAAIVKDWGLWGTFYKTNVEGTQNLLQEAEKQGAQRFVLVSSVAVHRYTGFRDADARVLPKNGDINNYAKSKVMAEEALLKANIETVIVRPGLWPFGTRDPNLRKIVRALRIGMLPLISGGKAVINTAYIGNLVKGLYLAGTHPSAKGKVYLIADEGMPSWHEIFSHVAKLIKAPKPLIRIPAKTVKPLGKIENIWAEVLPNIEPPITLYRSHLMINDVHFSIANAKNELDYAPETSWKEGLALSILKQ